MKPSFKSRTFAWILTVFNFKKLEESDQILTVKMLQHARMKHSNGGRL